MRRYDDYTEQRVVDDAKKILVKFFTNAVGGPIRTPFFLGQLQVLHEKDLFPWVTYNALQSLVDEGFLTIIEYEDIYPEGQRLENV